MKLVKMLAAATVAGLALAQPAFAAKDDMDMDRAMKMADADKDGMVSKAEAMKMAEKMFDKMDTKKAGKLDRKQFELFLKEFHMVAGG